MKRVDMRRIARYGGAAGALVAVVIAIAIAAATAEATPNKPYTANVHQTGAVFGSMTLALSNDLQASQVLGSANFTPPAGLTAITVTSPAVAGWQIFVDSGIVEFRANSSSTALAAGQSISATVSVTKTGACVANPPLNNSGKWQVEAKQSNDFSGQPGNDLTLTPASDLTPLGSYVFAPVESVVTAADNSLVHVPQIVVNQATSFNITALDTCGNVDADYSGGQFVRGTGLKDATFSALNWSGGSVTASLTPGTVEVGDQFSIKDGPSGISANSVSTPAPPQYPNGQPTFDVVQMICAGGGTICVWPDPNGESPITATSKVPGDNSGHASLGLGYKPIKGGETCGTGPVGSPVGDGIYIDPFGYDNTTTMIIVLTYPKSLAPKGPASSVVTCKGTDNEDGSTTWDRTAIPPCGNTPAAPCADAQNIQGGALQITLYLRPADPHTGGFSP
jgi:hypothetical protein